MRLATPLSLTEIPQLYLTIFKDKNETYVTHLSRYIWTLKVNNLSFDLKYGILAAANPCSNTIKRCNLCIE